ncbi:MAG: hypothetical protein KFB95_00950 [Simkaniaceae bacterium]|nr:MAG: hypothetical protein KFB95_00950 [Simkaniaceae bacterium]
MEGLRSLREQIRLENQTGKSHQSFSKVTDFIQLILSIWIISDKKYQERFWVRKENPESHIDNYMETMEEFLSTGEAVLDTSDYAVEMTPKQREMLQKLYTMLDDFDGDGDSADDPGYGINDAAIIEDPKFDKCRRYARLVYEELSGDDLDAWEKSRSIKP